MLTRWPFSRRPRLRRLTFFVIVLAALLAGYAVGVEPYWLEVTRHTVPASAAVRLTSPLRVAHVSDLHTRGLGRRERALLARLEQERPDLIVITGDTLAGFGGTHRGTRELLTQLKAPLGVYLVRGNWENWQPPGNEAEHYRLAGVKLLLNRGESVRPDVWVGGVDDAGNGRPDALAALGAAPPGALRILLFHSPAYFDQVADQVHFAFSGHTHGGQVRIPFLPPLWLPYGSWPYVEGWYEHGAARMYVSRGVGTSVLPVRFACRPELAIITIQP